MVKQVRLSALMRWPAACTPFLSGPTQPPQRHVIKNCETGSRESITTPPSSPEASNSPAFTSGIRIGCFSLTSSAHLTFAALSMFGCPSGPPSENILTMSRRAFSSFNPGPTRHLNSSENRCPVRSASTLIIVMNGARVQPLMTLLDGLGS